MNIGLLVAAMAALVVHGYFFELGAENQPLQVPLIERLVDPTLYPGDPLVDTLDGNPSIFFPAAAMIRRRFALEGPFLALHLATLAATAVAMGAIARRLGANRLGAFVAVLMLLISPIIRPAMFSRDTMVASWVTPTTLSFPILLFALDLLLRGRPGRAGIVAGLSAHVNMVPAGLFLMVAAPAALAERRGVERAARLGLGFVLVALPAIVRLPTDPLVTGSGTDFLELLRRYYPYHFLAGAQVPAILPRVTILIAAAWVAIASLPRSAAPEAPDRARRVAMAVAIPILAGIVFGELIPIAAMAQLHLLRADRWLYVILFAALGVMAGKALRGEEPWPAAAALAMVLGTIRGAYPLIAFGAGLSLIGRSSWPRALRMSFALPIAALGFLALARPPSFRVAVAVLVVLALTALVPILGRSLLGTRTRLATASALIGAVLIELARFNGTLAPDGLHMLRAAHHPDWREVQDWAAQSTSTGACFLTPPDWVGFRVYGRRTTVVERKDGAAMLWQPSFGPEWWERLNVVEAAMASGDSAALLGTARRYHAHYAVVPSATAPPELRPVHENPHFRVVAVAPPPP
jgi:hypothetical protein